MKRFWIISTLCVTAFVKGWGCAHEYSNHNYYMMNVTSRYNDQPDFEERFNQFWRNYVGDEDLTFAWGQDRIQEVAREKQDKEMLAYLEHLKNYLDISQQLRNTWEYPTKEELAERNRQLQAMKTAAGDYRGSRLRAQYALLNMRANMLLKDHAANIAYWEQKSGNLPEGAYKDMMRNIYAGALYHTGKQKQAFDIFVEQGDQVSIKWTMRKYRNLAGIQNIFAENPNAPTLYYLVQDFVNNVQETIDNNGDKEQIEWVDRRKVESSDARQFIAFADQVAQRKDVQDPCMWKTASALLNYLLGNQREALKAANEAMKLNGAPQTKDNARCVRLLVLASDEKTKGKTLLSELQWLDGMVAAEKEDGYCFSNARDRILMRALRGKYKRMGNHNMALAVVDFMVNQQDVVEGWNYRYSNEFTIHADSLNADQTAAYYKFITDRHKDPFEAYVTEKLKGSANYYNDMIGTKLMAENRFDEAVAYLEKVPLSFLESQNISYYMANRDWTVARWLKRQRMPKDVYEAPYLGKFTENPKIKFCKEILELKSRHDLSGDNESRRQLAYDLAVRYFQASHRGDCWYLTAYGWSSLGHLMPWQTNFEKLASGYLDESRQSENFDLRTVSIYASAFLSYDGRWKNEFDYDWETGEPLPEYNLNSHQYRALRDLSKYATDNASRMPQYVQKCDVLKQFRKQLIKN